MSKELFDNAGRDIKAMCRAIAREILWPYIFFSILIILGSCFALYQGITLGWFGFLIAIGVFQTGYAKSRRTVMLLYAYGEITDHVISIDRKLANCNSGPDSPVSPEKIKKVEPQRRVYRTASWECQFCGHLNQASSKYCEACGTEDIGIVKRNSAQAGCDKKNMA